VAAPATDLETLFKVNRNGTFGRVLSAYTIHTWSQIYPELRINQLVTRPARPVVRQIANTCIALDRNATIVAAVVSQALRITYLHSSPWETEPLKSLNARNSPGNEQIGAPILITQGEADRLILPSITKAFVDPLRGKAGPWTTGLSRPRSCARGP
jgi:hypothetical protein